MTRPPSLLAAITATALSLPLAPAQARQLKLRILGTTDAHMAHLAGYPNIRHVKDNGDGTAVFEGAL